MSHLEFLPPYQKSDSDRLDLSQEGMIRLTCLNTSDNLYVFNNEKYWSEGTRSVFMERVMTLWDE